MEKKNIILDTDIGPDCDDAAALALLCLHAKQGNCRILGVGHCTSSPYGAGTVDALLTHYGFKDVPVGTFSGKNFLCGEKYERYNKYIAGHFPHRFKEQNPPDAVKMYREILSEQEDQSVEFIAIGPLNQLSLLLDSEPDEISPLSGRELTARKVCRLTAMAGIFPTCNQLLYHQAEKEFGTSIEKAAEFNVESCIAAARNVADNWPSEKEYLGFEAGLIKIGKIFSEKLPANHPLRMAYQLYTQNGERYSWDILTVEHVLCPDSPHYQMSPAGRIRFDEKGRTVWQEEQTGRDHFIEIHEEIEKVSRDIDEFIASGD